MKPRSAARPSSSSKTTSIVIAGNNSKIDCSVHYTTGDRCFSSETQSAVRTGDKVSAVIENEAYTTPNLCVQRNQDGVPHILCSQDEVIVNGTKFTAHLLGASAQLFPKPRRQACIKASGVKIWDAGSVPPLETGSTPYVRFKADLRLTLEFESNGKRVTLRRKKDTDCFGPCNIMPR